MNAPKISVIVCTYNPQERFLGPTLDSLRAQDLPLAEWELIVIDNNSREPVAEHYDVSWHPHSRHVVETAQGLAHARRRGYRESSGALVVHSDDDNPFAPDYLSTAWRIAEAFPHIGTFRGNIEPIFLQEPKTARERELGRAIRVERSVWSNIFDDGRTMPFGAGMCVRRAVAEAYLQAVAQDQRRLVLGRSGARLLTGEDIDVNYTAVKAGFGTGLFRELTLSHFIPPQHMTEEHRINYDAGNAYSMVLLWFLHTGEVRDQRLTGMRALLRWLRIYLRMNVPSRRREILMMRSRREAVADMKKWGWLDHA